MNNSSNRKIFNHPIVKFRMVINEYRSKTTSDRSNKRLRHDL